MFVVNSGFQEFIFAGAMHATSETTRHPGKPATSNQRNKQAMNNTKPMVEWWWRTSASRYLVTWLQ